MLRLGTFIITCCLANIASAADNDAQRGQYIVERAGMCIDCHSPRDQKGQYIRSEWLHGASIDSVPKHPVPGWAEFAPRLAGLPQNYTEANLTTFLETGVRPDGSHAGPPMPQYRFSHDDAQGVVEYLKSLH